MNCPQCKAELRISKVKELEDRYLRSYTCPNTRCKNYKQPVEEEEVMKEDATH